MENISINTDLNNTDSYSLFISSTKAQIPILYEDNHILVVIKPAGILSQSDGSGKPDMLTLLKEYIKEKYRKPGDVFLGLVHRLDMPVSGIMVFAKTSKGASRISMQIRERSVTKKYLAIVHGCPPDKEGRMQTRLLKDGLNNIVGEDDEGKEAVLYYRLIETNQEKNISLMEIKLETGRSHQIRSQLSFSGNPILGDKKYGDSKEKHNGDIALFSFSFSFKHPTKDCHFEFTAIPLFRKEWKTFSSVLKNPE